MTARPTEFADWCTKNDQNKVRPSDAQIGTGWIAGQPPAAQHENFKANLVGQWIRYLDGKAASTVLASSLDFSTRLIGGGTWSYSGETLSWNGTFNVAVPSTSDSSNAVAPGSVVLSAGTVAYVNANFPFSTTATTQSGAAQLTNVIYGDMAAVGQAASGSGIPAGAKVTAVSDDGQTVTLSAAATASASNVTVSFTGSGTLVPQIAVSNSFVPGPSTVIFARNTLAGAIVGVGSGQMLLRQNEQKRLLAGGYQTCTALRAGGVVQALNPVYISPGAADASRLAGAVYLLDASSATGNAIRSQFAGFATVTAVAGATPDVVQSGVMNGFSGLTPGALYYATGASGTLSAAKPTAAGEWIVPVGVALSATQLLVCAGQPAQQVPAYKSVVAMGGFFYSAGGTSSYSGQTGFAAGSTANPTTVNHVPYRWQATAAGSIVGLAYDYAATVQFSSGRLQIGKNGTTFVDSGGQSTAQYQTSFAKNTYPFAAGDVLVAGVTVIGSNPNGISAAGNATLTVEFTP